MAISSNEEYDKIFNETINELLEMTKESQRLINQFKNVVKYISNTN
jgi:hypothetical protein